MTSGYSPGSVTRYHVGDLWENNRRLYRTRFDIDLEIGLTNAIQATDLMTFLFRETMTF
jgi:hypothetical protein